MQGTINAAYTDPKRDLINIYTQKTVPRKGDVPTTDELVNYAASEVRRLEKETNRSRRCAPRCRKTCSPTARPL